MRVRNLALGLVGAAGAAVAVKMLTRPGTVEWERVSGAVEHSENSHFVHVDGATVHYQEFGDPGDPTVLLVHGYTASTFVWHAVAPMFAEAGFHVIAPDLLGFGFSEKPRWFDYSIESQARIIVRLMDRLGIGRATVVGSSYGGAVAATLALDYAERVEKLVLAGAVCNDNVLRHPILRLATIPGVGESIMPFFADSRSFHKRRMRKTLSPANYDLISNERVASVRRPLAAADAHHALLATSRNWHAKRVAYDAPLINQPTLIIWGEDDRITPIEDGHLLHDRILHSRMVVLRDCGHLPMEEKSQIFTDLVTEFCHDRKGRIADTHGEEARLEP